LSGIDPSAGGEMKSKDLGSDSSISQLLPTVEAATLRMTHWRSSLVNLVYWFLFVLYVAKDILCDIVYFNSLYKKTWKHYQILK